MEMGELVGGKIGVEGEKSGAGDEESSGEETGSWPELGNWPETGSRPEEAIGETGNWPETGNRPETGSGPEGRQEFMVATIEEDEIFGRMKGYPMERRPINYRHEISEASDDEVNRWFEQA